MNSKIKTELDVYDPLCLLYLVASKQDQESVAEPAPSRSPPAEDSQPYCSVCQITFKSMKGLKQHEGRAHSTREKTILCTQCDRAFYHKHALKFHMNQVHLKITRQECPFCSKLFYNKYSVKQHILKCKAIIKT